MFAATCPFCKFRLKIPAEAQGQAVTCRSCKQRFRIKAAEDEPPTLLPAEEPEQEDEEGSRPRRRPPATDSTARILRAIAWAICVLVCGFCWLDFMHSSSSRFDLLTGHVEQPSAIQQAAAAAMSLVTMFMAYVAARAVDAWTRH